MKTRSGLGLRMCQWALIGFLLLISLQGCYSLTAAPFTLTLPERELVVEFSADSELSVCQVHELNLNELSAGVLRSKGCAASLRGMTCAETHFVFAARARADHGPWQLALAVVAVMGEEWHVLNATVDAHSTFLRIVADHPLHICKYHRPGKTWWKNATVSQDNLTCSIQLRGERSGVVVVEARSTGPNAIFFHAHAHYQQSERNPLSLTLDHADGKYDAGDFLHASCEVDAASPPTQVTWLLNDVEVTLDPDDADASLLDPWALGQTVQRVRVMLDAAQNGSSITCLAHYPGKPMRMSKRLLVAPRAGVDISWPLIAGVATAVVLFGVVIVVAVIVYRHRRIVTGEVVQRGGAVVGPEMRETAIYEDLDFITTGFSAEPEDGNVYDDVREAAESQRTARYDSNIYDDVDFTHVQSQERDAPALPAKKQRR